VKVVGEVGGRSGEGKTLFQGEEGRESRESASSSSRGGDALKQDSKLV
jgi:hypothetical protein